MKGERRRFGVQHGKRSQSHYHQNCGHKKIPIRVLKNFISHFYCPMFYCKKQFSPVSYTFRMILFFFRFYCPIVFFSFFLFLYLKKFCCHSRWTIKARIIRKTSIKYTKNKDALKELSIMDSSTTIKATVFANQFNLICHVCEGNIYLISGSTVQDKFRTEKTP
jgi:hypothetical protein